MSQSQPFRSADHMSFVSDGLCFEWIDRRIYIVELRDEHASFMCEYNWHDSESEMPIVKLTTYSDDGLIDDEAGTITFPDAELAEELYQIVNPTDYNASHRRIEYAFVTGILRQLSGSNNED